MRASNKLPTFFPSFLKERRVVVVQFWIVNEPKLQRLSKLGRLSHTHTHTAALKAREFSTRVCSHLSNHRSWLHVCCLTITTCTWKESHEQQQQQVTTTSARLFQPSLHQHDLSRPNQIHITICFLCNGKTLHKIHQLTTYFYWLADLSKAFICTQQANEIAQW